MFGLSYAYRSAVRYNEREVRFLPSPQTSRKAQNNNSMEEIKNLIVKKYPDFNAQVVKFDFSEQPRLIIRPDGEAFYCFHMELFEAVRKVYNILYHISYDNEGIKCVMF